ncbi:MAG: SGNH/GDSL hydrolase family protein [Nitrospirae bacterium]|nr:SGNH/GDSL hydrolase family protein [Nitrospirota bacterium]
MKDRRPFKKILQDLLVLFVTCMLLLGVSEIFLRAYNPFEFRVKGNKIILPVNKKYTLTNDRTDKLDATIIHTKNSLGFRGENPPADFKSYLSVMTVGGSTTECFLISDGKTWTDILGEKLKGNFGRTWINNAGLDGQSSLGHIVLMEDYLVKIRPRVILFLIGSNDRENRTEFNQYEKSMVMQANKSRGVKALLSSLADHSEVVGAAINFYRYIKSRNMGLTHGMEDYKTLPVMEMSEDMMNDARQEMKKINYDRLRERLLKLIRLSRDNGTEPVFITQPTLFGNAVDDVTGIDLSKVKSSEDSPGVLVWERLEMVNDVIRQVGEKEKVPVIDLSILLPKSSRYYYDFLHYSNEGNEKVADIIYEELCPYLTEKYGEYSTKACNTPETK